MAIAQNILPLRERWYVNNKETVILRAKRHCSSEEPVVLLDGEQQVRGIQRRETEFIVIAVAADICKIAGRVGNNIPLKKKNLLGTQKLFFPMG